MLFQIGDLELDDRALTLKRAGAKVVVQRKVLDLILYLIRNRERVVTDEELFRTVWAGVTVTRASIAHSAMKARRALGDEGRSPTMIESVRGRGLRFIANVVEVSDSSKVDSRPGSGPRAAEEMAGSIGIGSEAFFDLAYQMDQSEFCQTVTFPVLVFPARSRVSGNPWAIETASVSFDGTESAPEVPSRLEIFELWVAPSEEPKLVVGRTRACQIVVRAPSLSKRHAEFTLPTRNPSVGNSAGGMSLTDLGSHNGTWVNRVALQPNVPKEVTTGDVIRFGQVGAWILDAPSLHSLIHKMKREASS